MTLGCPGCAGIGVQLALESLSSFGWNRCPACTGIRKQALEIDFLAGALGRIGDASAKR
jgi:hypothetical protein